MDLLFPPRCAGCGESGARFCAACIHKSTRMDPQKCVFCGGKLPNSPIAHQCPQQGNIDLGLSWGLHTGPLRNGLHRFKYQRDLGLAEIFSGFLLEMFIAAGHEIDLIVPVPLAPKRLKERGFNQSYLLAIACARQLGIPCTKSGLGRIRETRSQVGLNIKQRKENVSGAFKARPRVIRGKRILLIDDVKTTGATLDACAEALKRAEALRVISLTLASAH